MPSRHRRNKEYYAVISGRIDEPTIFSSWGDAHPRVTGCTSEHMSFFTIEEAREYMEENGVTEPKEIIKDGAGETTPLRGSQAFYAVAHGAQPGIHKHWYGAGGSEHQVQEISGACYKRFRTLAQAEAFIEDWRESFADVWRRAIKQGLDQGRKPRDMKLGVESVLLEAEMETEGADMLDEVRLDRLSL